MIGYLKGELLAKQPPFVLLNVGGVGYELEAPMSTFYDLPDEGQTVALFAHLVVREDAQLLYGFSDSAQKQLFRLLLRVNGVGPRVALGVLSTLSATEFIACIQREDARALAKVPGIGAKTAQRMLLDLRDRIGQLGDDALATDASQTAAVSPSQDAVGALLALGYKNADALRAVRAVQSSDADAEDSGREELIRRALQYLSRA